MPKRLATLLARFSDSVEQHLFLFDPPTGGQAPPTGGQDALAGASVSDQNLMNIPITSTCLPAGRNRPFFNKAAETELSTPPDIAQTTFIFFIAVGFLLLFPFHLFFHLDPILVSSGGLFFLFGDLLMFYFQIGRDVFFVF